MRYLVGDIVKIKIWEDMKDKYGYDGVFNSIISPDGKTSFVGRMEEEINSDRILTIKRVRVNDKNNHYYIMEEMHCWRWEDWMIENFVESEIITNRFEILDIIFIEEKK